MNRTDLKLSQFTGAMGTALSFFPPPCLSLPLPPFVPFVPTKYKIIYCAMVFAFEIFFFILRIIESKYKTIDGRYLISGWILSSAIFFSFFIRLYVTNSRPLDVRAVWIYKLNLNARVIRLKAIVQFVLPFKFTG